MDVTATTMFFTVPLPFIFMPTTNMMNIVEQKGHSDDDAFRRRSARC